MTDSTTSLSAGSTCLPAAAQGHTCGPAAVACKGPHTPALHNYGDTTSVWGVVSESKHAHIPVCQDTPAAALNSQ